MLAATDFLGNCTVSTPCSRVAVTRSLSISAGSWSERSKLFLTRSVTVTGAPPSPSVVLLELSTICPLDVEKLALGVQRHVLLGVAGNLGLELVALGGLGHLDGNVVSARLLLLLGLVEQVKEERVVSQIVAGGSGASWIADLCVEQFVL